MVELDAMFVCDPSSASAYLTHASAYWDIPCRAFGKVLSCECKLQCMHYVYEGANMCVARLPYPTPTPGRLLVARPEGCLS